jgi:arginyl-tRNA synthetase
VNELQGKEARIPDDGYHGEYLVPLAQEVRRKGLDSFDAVKDFSLDYFIRKQKEVLESFGVFFKNWIRESWIRDQGCIEKVLHVLESRDLTFTQDGALFFKTTEYGDSRDRVIVTSDHRYTYLLPDIAYHQNKIDRGYQKMITVLGPDHHGQVKSLTSGIMAVGHPGDVLKVIIVQQVKLKKGGETVSMSKRAGAITTIDELLEKIPRDVARFFFLMRSCSQHLDFDLDLAMKESEENPVYYVQYAHARIRSILKHAAEKGIARVAKPDLSFISEPEEYSLIKQIIKFPEVTEDAVRNLDPYPLTYYLIELARIFHNFYQKHRVVSEDAGLAHARLFLVEKTAETIKCGLELIGVSSPESM